MEITGMFPEVESTIPIQKLEPSSSGQQDVKADLLCIETHNDNKMKIENERTGLSPEATACFHLETCMNYKVIADIAHPECNASSHHPLALSQVPVCWKSAESSSFHHSGVMADLSSFMPLSARNSSILLTTFYTSSLLLMPDHKLEIESSKQIPHFSRAWDCPPEFCERKALGFMVSFANMAESIKNMRIQDEPQLYKEKMSSLLDLEEDGFNVGPLKVRLDKLLHIRNHQIRLKNRKATLEKEILELEIVNCRVEQRLKLLIMCIMGLDEKKYCEMKALLDTQKTENCSAISKLEVDLHQVEASAEADFNSIAAASW